MKAFPFLSICICLFWGFCLVGLFLLSDIAGYPKSLSLKGEELMLYFSSEWLLEAVVRARLEANIKIISSPQSLISSCRYYFLKSSFLLLSLAYILEIAL